MHRNLTFWPEENDSEHAIPRGDSRICRCWCNPAQFVDVVGVDFGGGRMHLYSAAKGRGWDVDVSVAIDELLSLQSGTLAVGEPAHLATPRTKKSLAQPFTEKQLLFLYQSCSHSGITVKLYSHYHSGVRARVWAAKRFPSIQSAKKTDAADAMALALYVMHCNAVSLADPPSSFDRCPKRDYGIAVREYSCVALNAERTTGYIGRHMPHVIELGEGIWRKTGRSIGKKACYSIASLIATDINGVPFMFFTRGRVPGVEMWWRNVARMTPFHHRAGVARSNLMRHAFRQFLRRFGKNNGVNMGTKNKIVPFGDHDDVQAVIRTRCMQAFRRTVKHCYRAGVEIALKKGWATLDPVETPLSEATDGR